MTHFLKVASVLGMAAVAAVHLAGQGPAAAQAPATPQAPATAPTAGAGSAGGRGGAQAGIVPVKVLFVTKGHNFDRQGLLGFFDSLAPEVTYTHVEQPAAQVFYDQKNAAAFDVLVFYDAPGRVPKTGPDGKVTFEDASPESKVAFAQMLMAGKGLVFLHHSIAAWTHTWPEYQEVVGGACDWNNEIDYRGVHYPRSGAFGNTKQRITVVDKTHPIVQGLGDGFDFTDEAYACPYAADKNIHPLLTTDFMPQDPARNLGEKGKYSNLTGWYKSAENSPVVWLQHGHSVPAWTDPTYPKLVKNAIKWAASPDAMAWAKKNPTKIFKNVKPLVTPAK
jgi:trehalose utilization protein